MTIKSKALTTIRALLGDIGTELDGLFFERDQKMQRVEDLQNLPLSKADFLELMFDGIDDFQHEYRDRMQLMVDDFHSRPDQLSSAGQVKNLTTLAPWSGQSKTAILPVAIFALFGGEIKTSLSKVIADVKWPEECGISLVERRKEISKLNKEISKLDAQIQELKGFAGESGNALGRFSIGQTGKKNSPGVFASKNTGLRPE